MEPSSETALVRTGIARSLAGLVTSALAVAQLADGIAELPRHWWSAAAMAPLALGPVVLALGILRRSMKP